MNVKLFYPETTEQVAELLSKHEAAIVYGGATHVVSHFDELFSEVRTMVSLEKLGLDYMKFEESELRIGASTPLWKISQTFDSEQAGIGTTALEVLHETIDCVRPVEIMNMATIGGNLSIGAELDLPTTLIALNASVDCESDKGIRTVSLEDFYLGYLKTALKPNEFLSQIRIPIPSSGSGTAFQKYERTAVDLATVNASAFLTLKSCGECGNVRIVLGGVSTVPIRIKEAESLLLQRGYVDSRTILQAAEFGLSVSTSDDMRASAERRRRLSKVGMETVITKALERARERAAL